MQAAGTPTEGGAALVFVPVAWVVASLFLWLWYAQSRFHRLLKDVPTVPVKGIAVGLVETSGVVEHDEPLRAGLSGTPCVWHEWSVREHWRREERYKDQKGNVRTRMVNGSDVVASGGGWCNLRLADGTGSVIVMAEGASWTPVGTFDARATRGDALYGTKAPGRTVRGSTGVRSFTESSVPVGATAWVMGEARVRPDGNALEIGNCSGEGAFLISLAGERSHTGRALFWAGAGLVCAAVCAAMAGAMTGAALAPALPGTEPTAFLAGMLANGAAFGLVVLLLWSLLVRNGAVRVRTRWERAASLVDVELRRRSDLIPNLAAVAQAGAVHERHVQQAMAAMRGGTLAAAVCRVLVERYPALGADGAFLLLQRQLADTEERIALARRFEVESRQALIVRLQAFPQGTMARIMGVAMPPPPLPVPQAPARPPASPSSPGSRPPG